LKRSSRLLYEIYRKTVKIILQLFYDFQVWEQGPLPDGPKIYCSNHFSSSDAQFVTTLMKEPIHMVIGSAFAVPVIRTFLKATEQISAHTKEERSNVVGIAAQYLRSGESVYIFPEGDLNSLTEMKKFYLGMAKIYLACPAPIVPIGLIAPRRRVKTRDIGVNQVMKRRMTIVSRNYYANIGEAMEFPAETTWEDQQEAALHITDSVKKRIGELIHEIKTEKFWS
jgi:1-acyl-sn-glycerol-3-phosphate acyltransferase